MTPFFVYMNNNADYLQLCSANYTATDFEYLTEVIKDQYKYDMYLDNLPAIVTNNWYVPGRSFATSGVPVGRFDEDTDAFVFYNHFHIDVEVTPDMDSENYYRVVGFTVEPISCGRDWMSEPDTQGAAQDTQNQDEQDVNGEFRMM